MQQNVTCHKHRNQQTYMRVNVADIIIVAGSTPNSSNIKSIHCPSIVLCLFAVVNVVIPRVTLSVTQPAGQPACNAHLLWLDLWFLCWPFCVIRKVRSAFKFHFKNFYWSLVSLWAAATNTVFVIFFFSIFHWIMTIEMISFVIWGHNTTSLHTVWNYKNEICLFGSIRVSHK